MGIKLKEAIYKGKNIKIDDATEEMRGNLTCPKCGVELTYTNGYKKEINENIYYVPPFFRLKKKGVDHDVNCKYNTVGQLRILARDSDDNILEELNDGNFELRLHLISESIRELKKQTEGGEIDNTDNRTGNTLQKEFKQKEERLESYVSRMSKLMELRRHLEENSDISSKVRLNFRDKNGVNHRITWNHFYYETESFFDLYEYINQKKPQHPMCIFGKIRNINSPSDNFKFFTIDIEWPKWRKVGDGFEAPSIRILVKNKRLNDMLDGSKGKYIIFYGNFWDGKRYSRDPKWSFLNIRTELLHKNQFKIINEEDL